jgi:hypothetical protein
VRLNNLGDIDREAGRFDTAIARFRESVAIHERLVHDLASLRTETDLAPLGDRDDFRLLMLDVAMPADPLAPSA